MPPKRKVGTKENGLEAAFKAFCSYLSSKKNANGTIEAPESAKVISQELRKLRQKSQTINSSVVYHILGELKEVGESICSRMDAEIFCTIIDTVLQAEVSRSGERALYILAESLSLEDDYDETLEELQDKKDLVGKRCLQSLWAYFVDENKHFGTRRMAGILCLQLIRDSMKNVEKAGMLPEDQRRAIGRLILEEQDEILRTMCGQLISTIGRSGKPLQHLFPLDFPSQVYDQFPISAPGENGWGYRFQTFIDRMLEQLKPGLISESQQIGQLHWANVLKLTPPRNFGDRHHNIYNFMDNEQISLWAPSQEGLIDQILDVPLSLIKQVTIISGDSQGRTECLLAIESDEESTCVLNAKGIKLSQIAILGSSRDIESFKANLEVMCPNLIPQEVGNSQTNVRSYQLDIVIGGGSISMRKQAEVDDKSVSGGNDEASPLAAPDNMADFDNNASVVKGNDEAPPLAIADNVALPDDDASIAKVNKASKAVIPARRIAKIKPKAKRPILPNQSQVETAASKVKKFQDSATDISEVYSLAPSDEDNKLKKRGRPKGKAPILPSQPKANGKNPKGKGVIAKKPAVSIPKKAANVPQVSKMETQKIGARRGAMIQPDTQPEPAPVAASPKRQDPVNSDLGKNRKSGFDMAEKLSDLFEDLGIKKYLNGEGSGSGGDVKSHAKNATKVSNTPKPADLENTRKLESPIAASRRAESPDKAQLNTKIRTVSSSPDAAHGLSVPNEGSEEENTIVVEHETGTKKPLMKYSKDSSSNGKKRKAIAENTLPPKKRQSTEKVAQSEGSPLVNVKSTPPQGKQLRRETQNSSPPQKSPRPAAKSTMYSTNSLQNSAGSSPPQRSPRFASKNHALPPRKSNRPSLSQKSPCRSTPAKATSKVSGEVVSKDSTAKKSLDRKPKLISFGTQGPRNQGVSSAAKSDGMANPPFSEDDVEVKRKRDRADITEAELPPKKRLESSPVNGENAVTPPVDFPDMDIDPFDGAGVVTPLASMGEMNSSPPELGTMLDRAETIARENSQSSRVDINGSPIASKSSAKADHVSKLKDRLGDAECEEFEVIDEKTGRPRTISDTFGPRIQLSQKQKARHTSPDRSTERYVLHHKTADGRYEDMFTEEAIKVIETLDDPFTAGPQGPSQAAEPLGAQRGSNSFFDRLLVENIKPSRKLPGEEVTSRPKQAGKVRMVDNQGQNTPQPRDDSPHTQRTDVRALEILSPIDMTSTSNGRESSQSSRSPHDEKSYNEVYNIAIRPHYTDVRETLHQIADELVIRLSDEEKRMELLVNQYKDNGAKIVGKVAYKRDAQKATISQELEKKKSDLMSVYSEAKGFIHDTVEDLKENSVRHVEKDWQGQQESIDRAMAKMRKNFE